MNVLKRVAKVLAPNLTALAADYYRLAYVYSRISKRRPHYAYCMRQAADLAQRLGHHRISAIEFGVANGNGLVELERIGRRIERMVGVKCEIYGFDLGSGLPRPRDERDLPYWFAENIYMMDEADVRRRLSYAKLIIGDVRETAPRFFTEHGPAPIGCVFNDLDYYSSTRDSFRIFETSQLSRSFLPRIFMYFDDIVGTGQELYNDFTGERLAIREFNDSRDDAKISKVYALAPYFMKWHHKIFSMHFYSHPDYSRNVFDQEQVEIDRAVGR